MRPAYMFAETAAQFASRIEVAKDSVRIDGKSVLSILTLGATQGSDVSIEAIGDDAQEAIDTLSGLVTSGFVAPDIGDLSLIQSPSPRDRQKSRMPSSA